MTSYPTLNRAQLSYDYLHTNSTTHEFLFGAIVELVDNSRDAGAERCDIFTVLRSDLRGHRMLCFFDNGIGMAPNEARSVMTFGYSAKRRDPNMIGQYGNGLKSGAMRTGKDMILFTKKDNCMTCVFLSRTFHEEENIDEVIIPAPSFDSNKKPLLVNDGDEAKHEIEMDIILKYSPFRNENDFLTQFDMIKGDHGTLVIVYNLKLLENGEPELDFVSDPFDIKLSDPEGGDISDAKFHLERISLRSYLAIIYADPRMKLYIQGKKIRTRRIVNCLYKVRQYKYSSAKFKTRAEKQIQEAKDQLTAFQERLRETESKLSEFEKKNGSNPTNKDIRIKWRQLQDKVTLSKQDIKRIKDLTDEKVKNLKEPKILNFMFGLNLDRRTHDGCFIYNNGRLIRMYEKVGPQLEGTKKCCGVVGVVDIPFVVLEPTHNKQDFADSREYRQLLRAMGEHMEQYWRDLNLVAQPGGLIQFWQQFGYLNNDWNIPPSDEERFIKKRLMSVNLTLQCDLCLKWRILPYESKQAKAEFLDTWSCQHNPDSSANKCSAAEKFVNFPVGKLDKELVTVDQKRELLEKKIQKQQAELQQLSKVTDVKSKKDIGSAQIRAKQTAAAAKPVAEPPKKSRVKVRPLRPRPDHPSIQQKPRTKADLRKQLEKDKIESSESAESSDESESSTDAEDNMPLRRNTRSAFVLKKKQPQPPAKAPAPDPPVSKPPQPPAKRPAPSPPVSKPPTAKKSAPMKSAPIIAASTSVNASTFSSGAKSSAHETIDANVSVPITVSLDKTKNDKKLAVEKLEAHSTNQTLNDEPLSPVVSSTNSSAPQTGNGNGNSQMMDDLAGRLRRFFYYFLPPNWNKLTKQQVGQLTPEELLKVDLPEFFQAYECGLKRLVADHQKTAEVAHHQLRRLRNATSAVLKDLKPNLNIQAGIDTEEVDQVVENLLADLKHKTVK